MSEDLSRIVLGTAQLGSDYGIANQIGMPTMQGAVDIVQTAWENGIREFDSAQAYGKSEQVLGRAMADLGIADQIRVISKLDPTIDHLDADAVRRSVEHSLNHLGKKRLWTLMIHQEDRLSLWNDGLGKTLLDLKKRGVADRIGLSAYTPDTALAALATPGLDAVQVPANLLDIRFSSAGVFKTARESGKQVYIRSAFLQGLLLMAEMEIPEGLSAVLPAIEAIDKQCKEMKLSRRELALGYLKEAYPEAKVVIGVESAAQLMENCRSWVRPFPGQIAQRVFREVPELPERLLNPALWPAS